MMTDHASGKLLDELMAADMNEMSFAERNRMFEELHGVDELVTEEPFFVSESLEALEVELNRIENKSAYNQARQQNPAYVNNPKWRLMFLRADLFDPAKAASRLVKFLEAKLRFFGAHVLTRSIYLSDLELDTLDMFKRGFVQLLPERSRSGKAVSVVCPPLQPVASYDTIENAMKNLLYLLSSHAESDEESQRRGLLHIVCFPGRVMTGHLSAAHGQMGKMEEALPIRFTGVHFCSHSDYFKSTKYFIMKMIIKTIRKRLRFHDGTPTEIRYNLLTYGVPVQHLPVDDNGEVKNTAHLKWVAKQKIRDEAMARTGQFDLIDLPAKHDVLFGRGRNFHDHFGNAHMRTLVENYLVAYEKGSRADRDEIRWQLWKDIQKLQGQFLTRNANGWYEAVPTKDVLEKIERSFRSALSSSRKGRKATKAQSVATEENKRARIFVETSDGICNGCF